MPFHSCPSSERSYKSRNVFPMFLNETNLSPYTVTNGHFGRLVSLHVEGQIYAQPLVVSDLDMPGRGQRTVVYVVTMRNNVYAYDACSTNEVLLWHTNLGAAMSY